MRLSRDSGWLGKCAACGCLSAVGSGPLTRPPVVAAGPFAFLQVIATSLPPEEIEGIRRMFCEMDDDGSGTISFEELREGEA